MWHVWACSAIASYMTYIWLAQPQLVRYKIQLKAITVETFLKSSRSAVVMCQTYLPLAHIYHLNGSQWWILSPKRCIIILYFAVWYEILQKVTYVSSVYKIINTIDVRLEIVVTMPLLLACKRWSSYIVVSAIVLFHFLIFE